MNYSVSVALCTYNGSAYIKQQIDSILSQTILPDEIIICDDGSSDGTVDLVKELLIESELNWKIMVNDTNLGVIKNFEQAILECSSDIIFTADQDDVWLQDKIEIVIERFKLNNKLSVVFTDAFLVDKNLKKTGYSLWSTVFPSMNKLENNRDLLSILLKGNIMTGATMAFSRSLIHYIKPFNDYWIHDYWIAIMGTLFGEVEMIDQPLILYRQHENNVLGAPRLSFTDKLLRYTKNFKYAKEISNNKYIMFKELSKVVSSKRLSTELEMLINECVSFWYATAHLCNDSKINSIGVIFKRYSKGQYHKFYTGSRGAIRDLLYVIRMEK